MASSLTLGWIGLGVMGLPMCTYLVTKGHKVKIYARNPDKVKSIIEKGAELTSFEDVGKSCDIIFIMVGFPKDVKDVVYGTPGLLNLMKKDAILVDHSTNSPSACQEIYEDFKKKGLNFIDAPVSGGDVFAQQGILTVLGGGEKQIFEKIVPFVSSYSKAQNYVGKSGQGAHTKMIAQMMLGTNLCGAIEGMIYAKKVGMDDNQVFEILKNSAASSSSMVTYIPRVIQGDLKPGLSVEIFLKDLELILEEARRYHIVLPVVSQIRNFYEALMANGGSKLGFQGVVLTLEKLNGIQREDGVGKKQESR